MSSVFDDKQHPPTEETLAEALGRTKAHWDRLVAFVNSSCEGASLEWKFYGKKHGWQLKALRKRRALLYLIPHARSFLAGMALNDAAVAAVQASRLPEALVQEIVGSRAYPEGRPARVEVTSKKTADQVQRLLKIKLSAS